MIQQCFPIFMGYGWRVMVEVLEDTFLSMGWNFDAFSNDMHFFHFGFFLWWTRVILDFCMPFFGLWRVQKEPWVEDSNPCKFRRLLVGVYRIRTSRFFHVQLQKQNQKAPSGARWRTMQDLDSMLNILCIPTTHRRRCWPHSSWPLLTTLGLHNVS